MEANGVNNLPYQNPPFVDAHEATFSGLALPTTNLAQRLSFYRNRRIISVCRPER